MKTENNSVATHPVIFCIKKISQFCIGKLSPQIGPYLSVKKWSIFLNSNFGKKRHGSVCFAEPIWFLKNTYYRNLPNGLMLAMQSLIFTKWISEGLMENSHTPFLCRKPTDTFMKMQPFNQQKATPFKVEHGRWGLKGPPFQPTATPQKIHFTR